MSLKARPAVFIFGWLGSSPRNLKKIKSIYDNFDIDVITYIQDPKSLLGFKKDKKGFNQIYQQAQNRPIICHAFSLNGASAFCQSLTLNNHIIKPNIDLKGLIFDSAPGHVYKDLYKNAFSKAISPHSKTKQKCIKFILSPLFDIFLLFAKKHRKESKEIIDAIYKSPIAAPTMLMTSKGDEFINYKDVLNYGERVKESKNYLETHLWNESAHVKMFYDHKAEYSKYVQEFTKKFLIQPK